MSNPRTRTAGSPTEYRRNTLREPGASDDRSHDESRCSESDHATEGVQRSKREGAESEEQRENGHRRETASRGDLSEGIRRALEDGQPPTEDDRLPAGEHAERTADDEHGVRVGLAHQREERTEADGEAEHGRRLIDGRPVREPRDEEDGQPDCNAGDDVDQVVKAERDAAERDRRDDRAA